jgi:hypothetical protein
MLIMGLLAGAGGYVYFLIKNKEKEQLIKKAQEVFIAKTRVSNQLDYRKMVVEIIDEFYEKNRRADNAAELIRSCADDSLELKAFLKAYENAGDMRIREFLKGLFEYLSPEDKQEIEENSQWLRAVYDRLKIEIEYLENQKQAWELVDKQEELT